ncbi:MAG: hypothetical protein P8Y48_17640 [Novosphingobium sp.]
MAAPSRTEGQKAGVVRPLVVFLVTLIIAGFALIKTVGFVLAQSYPELALQFSPGNVKALDAKSAAFIDGSAVGDTPATQGVADAVKLARRALDREPSDVPALRNLALYELSVDNKIKAASLFNAAHALSRRDFETELWTIEDRVAHNDIDGALTHYDHALRTTPEAATVLLPVLAKATLNPDIQPSVVRLLQRRPLWRNRFLWVFLGLELSPATIAQFMDALGLDPRKDVDRAYLQNAVARLAAAGEPAHALALIYSDQRRDHWPLLRNGHFRKPNIYVPLDWELAADADLSGLVDRVPGIGPALSITARNGSRGNVARQVVALKPGAYSLTFSSGGASGSSGQITLNLTCMAGEGSSLLHWSRSAAGEQQREILHFEVPKGCSGQAFTITASPSPDGVIQGTWVTDLVFKRG